MNYFDLHCDTAFEMYHKKQGLADNTLAVSLKGFDAYEKKAQVFAVWSDNEKTGGECYGDFFKIFDCLKNEIEVNADRAVLCTDRETLRQNDTRLKIIPAIEGSKLLENDLSRLEILREYGVRVLTIAWGGLCEACGAHDTDAGLSDFGVRVVETCEKLGILLDVSHLSAKGFWDLTGVAKKPFFASHSNAAALCEHTRNLTDLQAKAIADKGGIIGVNLVGQFLSKSIEDNPDTSAEAVREQVVKHLVHLIEKAGENAVALGCDMDGTDPLPGLETADKVASLGAYMKQHGASDTLIDDIFYRNACRFFENNL